MYGRHYFGSRYFGAQMFGDGGDAEPPVVLLPAGICSRSSASSIHATSFVGFTSRSVANCGAGCNNNQGKWPQ